MALGASFVVVVAGDPGIGMTSHLIYPEAPICCSEIPGFGAMKLPPRGHGQ